jgi:ribonuclease BN (tRNA processing enzyme)
MTPDVEFIVLGSGTTVPSPNRGPAGFLLRVGSDHYLVDGGSGTMQRCAKLGIDPRKFQAGFYSHRHPDHTGDLVPLLFAMKVGPPGRMRDYPIYAGDGFQAFFDGLLQVYSHWIQGSDWSVVVHEIPLDKSASIALKGFELRTAPANHSAGALHLRFNLGDHAVVFSGDTGPSEALQNLAKDCDLLICECAGSNSDPLPGHLYPAAIVELAQRARPKEIWLTHFYPGVDAEHEMEQIRSMGIPIRRAEDGDRWTPPR